MLRVIRSVNNTKDVNSGHYLAGIRRAADKMEVQLDVTLVASQEEFDAIASVAVPTLVLQPCEFDISKLKVNIEKNQTARVVFGIIEESIPVGATVAIMNRSELIGKPLFDMLLKANYTPIMIHTKTSRKRTIINMSHAVVLATGVKQPEFLSVKPLLVVDVSDDAYPTMRKRPNDYVGMKEIGTRTVHLLLKDVIEWWAPIRDAVGGTI